MKSIILAALVVAAPLFAQATLITTIPEAPLAGDAVTITVSSDSGCPPDSARIEMSGRTIDVIMSVPEMPCPPAIWNWVSSARTAPLASGQWTVRALKERANQKALLAERELLVRSTGGQLSVTPTTVPLRGGMVVRISREGIGTCPASGNCFDPVVTIGGDAATVVSIDRDALDVVVPAGSAGLASVAVIGRDGTASWTANDALYYFAPDQKADPSVFERILLPLMFDGPGAFGSQWTTELRIFNSTLFSIDPLNRFNLPCQGPYGCPPQIPARQVLRFGVSELGHWQHGYVLAVPHEVAPELHYGLHIRDLSRQGEGWGTEIPVIPASEMSDSVTLLDVPLDDRYRRSLRIYGIDAIDGTRVVLTWHGDSATMFAVQPIELRTLGRCVTEPCWFPEPAGAIIPLGIPFPFQSGDRVRLELRTVAPVGAKIWAFVSLTNNDTQQVTTITPQ